MKSKSELFDLQLGLDGMLAIYRRHQMKFILEISNTLTKTISSTKT
jgi:uncharacterized linocin/CFP29 family protein